MSNLMFIVGYALADSSDYGRSYSLEDSDGGSKGWFYGLLLCGGLYAIFYYFMTTPGKNGKDRTFLGCGVVIAIFIIIYMVAKACR